MSRISYCEVAAFLLANRSAPYERDAQTRAQIEAERQKQDEMKRKQIDIWKTWEDDKLSLAVGLVSAFVVIFVVLDELFLRDKN